MLSNVVKLGREEEELRWRAAGDEDERALHRSLLSHMWIKTELRKHTSCLKVEDEDKANDKQ